MIYMQLKFHVNLDKVGDGVGGGGGGRGEERRLRTPVVKRADVYSNRAQRERKVGMGKRGE